MSDHDLVHPELRPFLDTLQRHEMNADLLKIMRTTPPRYPPSPDVPGVTVTERRLPPVGDAPGVRVLVYEPTGRAGPFAAIVHMHGGGLVIGSPEMNDADNRLQCAEVGCVIVSVDYRLPPEAPFPAPLDDCYAALGWLHGAADELDVDRSRIAVKGESAGGGLAAGLALLARDRGEYPICFQCLTYPMIDDRTLEHPFAGRHIWTGRSNRFGWASYLGDAVGGPDVSPYAAPARAEALAGLPPTWILTATLDLFVEEDLEYARRLTHAGVPTELIMYASAYHGFQMAGDTSLARRYARDVHEALSAALAPPVAEAGRAV